MLGRAREGYPSTILRGRGVVSTSLQSLLHLLTRTGCYCVPRHNFSEDCQVSGHSSESPDSAPITCPYRALHWERPYSSSLESSSSSSAASAFLAGFFFFFLFLLLLPVERARGCSRILRISSSVIFLSVLNCDRSGAGAAANLVRPFLVIAVSRVRCFSVRAWWLTYGGK